MYFYVYITCTCRSYAVDEYRKPFWEVFGSYLEDASSVAGEQMIIWVLHAVTGKELYV